MPEAGHFIVDARSPPVEVHEIVFLPRVRLRVELILKEIPLGARLGGFYDPEAMPFGGLEAPFVGASILEG
jgi:hypothetical protein